MKLIKSNKFKLPKIFLLGSDAEINELPIGIPYIIGGEAEMNGIIAIMEYEMILNSAENTGFKFNFPLLMKEAGFRKTSKISSNIKTSIPDDNDRSPRDKIANLIRNSNCYIDMEILKNLKIFPTYMDDIEAGLSVNINSFISYNPHMYNKKLGGMYGGIELISPRKNLIIVDISGSVPQGISATNLALSKTMAGSFYADILITGSISTLYENWEINKLDIETIYNTNGMDNDQVYFKKLVSKPRKYGTAIVFGDNDNPGFSWCDDSRFITDAEGQKINKWEIENIISLHTGNKSSRGSNQLAGYARWFTPTNSKINHINDWVKYFN